MGDTAIEPRPIKPPFFAIVRFRGEANENRSPRFAPNERSRVEWTPETYLSATEIASTKTGLLVGHVVAGTLERRSTPLVIDLCGCDVPMTK